MGKWVLSVPNFLNSSSLTSKISEVVCSALTNFTSSKYLYFVDSWSVEWENPLNPCSVGHFTNGEGGSDAVVVATNAYSLKGLNTLFFTFANSHVNSNGISRFEFWDVLTLERTSNLINYVHFEPLPCLLFPIPKESVEYRCYC